MSDPLGRGGSGGVAEGRNSGNRLGRPEVDHVLTNASNDLSPHGKFGEPPQHRCPTHYQYTDNALPTAFTSETNPVSLRISLTGGRLAPSGAP